MKNYIKIGNGPVREYKNDPSYIGIIIEGEKCMSFPEVLFVARG
jgi:hypothetical protein